METHADKKRAYLEWCIAQAGGVGKLADILGVNQPYLSTLRRGREQENSKGEKKARSIGRELLEKLEGHFGPMPADGVDMVLRALDPQGRSEILTLLEMKIRNMPYGNGQAASYMRMIEAFREDMAKRK